VTRVEDDTALAALERAAERDAAAPLLRVEQTTVSVGEALAKVQAIAAALTAFGGTSGERVAIMSGNCEEAAWSWLGAGAAGAIDLPLNAAARGTFLAAQLADCTPRVLIGQAEHLDTMAESLVEDPALVVCLQGEHDRGRFAASVQHLTFDEFLAVGRASPAPARRPRGHETATVLYTSGTTGASKGVMIPQRYWPVWGRRGSTLLEMTPADVLYCVQPLFHIDARAHLQNAVASGALAALGLRFSASRFWDEIREHDASLFSYIGTMLWLLYKQPESDRDRDHRVRAAPGSSTPSEIQVAFERRFGVSLREGYGMTECGYLLHATERTPPGALGDVVPEMQLALLDDHDVPVTRGSVGEACFRPVEPFVSVQGYWNRPADTLAASRNQWFHSGDLLVEGEDREYRYLGRKKDSIRRRGENVSAWEVEQAATSHPDVLEAAAIGVPSDVGEEEVALLVVLRQGSSLLPRDVLEHVAPDLPMFAAPRYVEVVDALPKTASERIDKAAVRQRGLGAGSWDAQA
jgi:crotonobetaine/carnitine-CoA ligase